MRTCAFGGYLVCVLWAGIHTHQDLAAVLLREMSSGTLSSAGGGAAAAG